MNSILKSNFIQCKLIHLLYITFYWLKRLSPTTLKFVTKCTLILCCSFLHVLTCPSTIVSVCGRTISYTKIKDISVRNLSRKYVITKNIKIFTNEAIFLIDHTLFFYIYFWHHKSIYLPKEIHYLHKTQLPNCEFKM